jgi:hypothetical protein
LLKKGWDISRELCDEQELNRNVELKLRVKIKTILFQNYKRESNLIGHLDLWFLFHNQNDFKGRIGGGKTWYGRFFLRK